MQNKRMSGSEREREIELEREREKEIGRDIYYRERGRLKKREREIP